MVKIIETNYTTSHVLERTTQRTSWAQTSVPFVGRKVIFRLTALSIGGYNPNTYLERKNLSLSQTTRGRSKRKAKRKFI